MYPSRTTATLTSACRDFCDQLVETVIERRQYDASPAKSWPTVAAEFGLDWHDCCDRLVGGLPESIGGDPLIHGLDRYVVKIDPRATTQPVCHSGNYREVLVWNAARKHGAGYLFAPVIGHASEYRWLIMPHVAPVGDETARCERPEPYYDRCKTSIPEAIAMHEQTLNSFDLDLRGQRGITADGTVVAADYAHLYTTTAVSTPIWAGTYDHRGRVVLPDTVDARNRRRRILQSLQRLSEFPVIGFS